MRFLIPLMLMLSTALDAAEREVLDKRILELSADELPTAAGVASERLSVAVWDGDGFNPVPFQIDEIGEADLVWFPASGLEREGRAGRFDGKDRLLLLFADAGLEAPEQAQPEEGELLARIALDDAGQQARVFYLLLDNAQRSEQRYVRHDVERGVTETEGYTLRVDPDNELNWRHLDYKTYQGEGSIIDTLKMRMSAGLLYRGARITLDNDNLRPELIGFKEGPIRSVMHLETRVVFGGISMMRLQVQAHRYPWHYEAHTYARIPALYKTTLRAPEVAVSIDGNAQYGAVVRTARGGDLEGLIDGRIDDEEKRLIKRGLSTDESWILFDSQRGFTMLTRLDVPPELSGIPLGLLYQDDAHKEVGPEQFPGQLPNIGYVLNDWPPERELRFAVSLLFDSALGDIEPGRYADLRLSRPAITVTPLNQ